MNRNSNKNNYLLFIGEKITENKKISKDKVPDHTFIWFRKSKELMVQPIWLILSAGS